GGADALTIAARIRTIDKTITALAPTAAGSEHDTPNHRLRHIPLPAPPADHGRRGARRRGRRLDALLLRPGRRIAGAAAVLAVLRPRRPAGPEPARPEPVVPRPDRRVGGRRRAPRRAGLHPRLHRPHEHPADHSLRL